MSVFAPAEVEKQLPNSGMAVVKKGVDVPASPVQVHERAVQKISDNLTRAGHPQSPQQVSAQGGAEAVLSKIEQSGIGAEIVGDLGDALDKMRGNVTNIITGSENTHTTKRPKMGLATTLGRVTKIANARGPQNMSNLLFRDRKAA